MDQQLQIVRCNQEIIHSQRDEPLQEFPNVPIFPPVPDSYGSLTPVELAAFYIGPARVSSYDNDEAQADDNEEKRVISISVFHSSVVCNMDKNLLYVWLVIL
jgi:hypothetical protein